MGGFSALGVAVAAAATTVSTTVGVEAAQTRGLLSTLFDTLITRQTPVIAPPGVTVTCFRFGGLNNNLHFSRVNSGPANDNHIYYGLTLVASVGSNTTLTFDRVDYAQPLLAGPRYYDLVLVTVGLNSPVLGTIVPP